MFRLQGSEFGVFRAQGSGFLVQGSEHLGFRFFVSPNPKPSTLNINHSVGVVPSAFALLIRKSSWPPF